MESPARIDIVDLREFAERPLPPADRAPINAALGQHDYVESEFPEGAGHCDLCGGGPAAEIHQKPVDQLARIADALERIADVLESSGDLFNSVCDDDSQTVIYTKDTGL